jgi:large subunit ribosomal protein L32
MANPRRKFSKQRKRKRQGQQRLAAPHLTACPQCMEPKLPHRVCPKCGYYAGASILPSKEE